MSRYRTALIAIAILALIPALAFARPGGPRDRGGDGPGFRIARHFLPPPGYLDLSEEQIEATQAIHESLRDQLGALRDEHRALREELRSTLEAGDPDPTTVGEMVIAIHGQRGGFRSVLEAADAEFSALLTPEQLEKWENFKELRGAAPESPAPRTAWSPRSHGDGEWFGPGGFDGPPFGE